MATKQPNDYENYDPYGNYQTKGEDPYSLLMKMSSWNKAIRSTISDVQESLDGTIERQSQIIQEVDRIELNVLDIMTGPDGVTSRVGKLEVKSDEITLNVSHIDTRVGEAEGNITVMAGEIALKANSTVTDGLTSKMANAEIRLNGIDGVIALTATKAQLDTVNGRLVTAESTITAQAGLIGLKANSSVVDNIGSRVSTAEVTINSLSGSISSKVSNTDYNGYTIASLINQTASQITIAANAIDLLGITNVANFLTLGTGFGSNTGIYFKGAAIGIESYGDTLNLNAPDIYLNGRVSMDFPAAPRLASHQQGATMSFAGNGDMTIVVNGSSFTYARKL